ncbi:MAG TPA: hypothetical protein PKC59_02160 [Burkholderiaceae bacterium]|nr:hypothetical protein [Burkholderiaceae bacterium]HMX10413.1 hypothetical protein [Burkholderiaceae bacterium]HMZ01448.1 hypothetical protein [Burkholderiaceae bacterium]HNB44533.1 hypothetical protein [Burkholderiaceae bacterium]HNG78403.1 hypothetical protein [Burkholderiaceae bacterium]
MFCVGVAACCDMAAMEDRWRAIRARVGFSANRILSGHSRDKHKVSYFNALLEDWLAGDQLTISVGVFRRAPNVAELTAAQRVNLRASEAATAIGLLPRASELQIAYKRRGNTSSVDDTWAAEVKRRAPTVTGIAQVQASGSEVLQFLDAVTGTLRQSFTRNTHNAAKQACQSRLFNALGVSGIENGLTHRRCLVHLL